MRRLIYMAFVLLAISSCGKINYYDRDPVEYTGTEIIAHRGGSNDTIRDNTYEGCVYALQVTDGIEVDVQMSKDRTIWLSHSARAEGCNERLRCFAEMRDSDIEAITTCNGNDISYTKLEEVLAYMSSNNIKKTICIDLKGWAPCSGNSTDIEGMMRAEAEEVIKLAEKYGLAECILIETNVASVLKWAKRKNKKIGAYITSYGDFEKGMLLALKHDLDGISFKSNFIDEVTINEMNLLHKKGLKMIAWAIPDSAAALQLIDAQVDHIQVDL